MVSRRRLAELAARLGRTPLGRTVVRRLPAPVRTKLWKGAGGEGEIARRFSRPETAESAVEEALAHVRRLLGEGRSGQARTFADLVHDQPDARPLGCLLRGVVAAHERRHRLAAAAFDEAPDLAFRHAGSAYLDAVFASDPAVGLRVAEGLLDGPSDRLGGEEWFTLVGHLYGLAAPEATAKAFARADADSTGDGRLRRRLDWTRPWIGAEPNRSSAPVPEGRVSFALIDYRQPGPDGGASSRNIGDWAQTLASLGHLVRHRGARFHGTPELAGLLERLQERVRPELVLDGPVADVEVCVLQRDASSYQQFPPNTWALVFGWFMHPLFDLEIHDFPLHRNIEPIFVSFHCAKKAMLTDEAVAYLKANSPIGCRDWTTVDILLSLGIPAFFSGCITTTVNTVFPDLSDQPAPRTLYVDATRSPVPPGVENVRQSLPQVLTNTFEQNVEAVVERLDRWRADYTEVETSRLHVYLPCRSLGLRTRYEPDSFSDPRVNGLLPLSDEGFEAIRVGMRERLAPVMAAILEGRSADQVRDLWRQLTAEEVETARRRHEKRPVSRESHPDAVAARRLRPAGPPAALNVVYVPRSGEAKFLPAALRASLRQLPRDAAVWVVGPGARPVGVQDDRLRFVDTSTLFTGPVSGEHRDRVLSLLPELLPADRAVVLPVASVVVADLAGLAEVDLAGSHIAARLSSSALTSGSQSLFRAARAFDREVELANELLRETFQRHTFDFPALDVEVLVLDLAGMREAGTTKRLLDGIDRYRLSWANSLLFEFGSDVRALDPAWARVPTRDPETDARIWVWLDSPKPWSGAYSSSAALWEDATAT